jgi:mono/diheme cytochrome c family protein
MKATCRSLLSSCALLLLACAGVPAHADDALVKRGEYLARLGDCVGCHTVPQGKPFAGGLYMPTPFGDISTPNITPDKATGIGNWTDDDFYRAMHDGIGHDKEFLYPVFPFPWYAKVTRSDVLAIKAYLFSLPPENAPRKPLEIAFPFDIRTGLEAWRLAFFHPKEFVPDPKKSAEVNRGAYLVEGLGHCGECHNKENLFGASDWSGRLEGGQIEGWYAPNITADGHQGVGSWSEAEIVTFLKTGGAPGKGVALGPMKETIDDSLQYVHDDDLHAMAAYLKSVTPDATYRPASPETNGPTAGAEAYLSYCASCHRVDGTGVKGKIVALAGNGAVRAQGPQDIIRVVLGGLDAAHGLSPMPAVGVGMTDQQVAEVVNYIRGAWGNAAPQNAEAGMVADLRAKTQSMIAGNLPAGCPPVGDPKLAKAIDAAGVRAQLKGVTLETMLQRIDTILPKLDTSGIKGDDVVDGLTTTYCSVVTADATVPPPERAQLIGNFAVLTYGQINRAGQKN